MKRVLAFYLIVCLTAVGAAWVYERTRPAQEAAAIGSSLPVVVLDAGHGGEDGGAVTATGVYESRLNLEITLRLNDFLQLLGVPTRMVRTGDVSVSTEGETVAQRKSSDIRNRVALVESIPGCWLVSVHQNRFEQEQYRGAQVFYRSSEESKRLAQTLQEQLCEKMRVEQSAYCLWLTAQPPEEILHHAYEYSVREDIILATEEMNLTPAQVRALLKSPAPLADVYKDFSKLETDYMSIVAQCVEDRADDLLKKEQQQNPPKVYRQSVTYAREHGELQQYHASCHLNERCRDEIDAALAQRFDGMRLGAGAVEQVVAEYGLERTKYVLAAAIQTRDGDGRISRTNREWADSIRTIKDMDRRGFDRSCYYADLQAHTCLLDGFVNQVRKFEKAKAQPAQDTPER